MQHGPCGQWRPVASGDQSWRQQKCRPTKTKEEEEQDGEREKAPEQDENLNEIHRAWRSLILVLKSF